MTDDFKTVTPTDVGLSHSDRELKRLEQQKLLIGPFTRCSFHEAGIRPGIVRPKDRQRSQRRQ